MRFPNGDTFYVDPQLGNYVYTSTDVSIPSKGFNIELKRYFNSSLYYDPPYNGWYFDFDEHLYIDPYDESVIIKFPTGNALRFEYDSDTGTFTPTTADNYMEMERITDVNDYYYIMSYHSGEKHYFNGNGDLIKKEDAIGNCISYLRERTSYPGPKGLTKIVGPCGREITVDLTGPINAETLTFTDWTGRTFAYTYDSTSGGIATYTDPNGNVTTYGYSFAIAGFETITYPEIGLFVTLEGLGPSPNLTKVKKATYANGLIEEYTYDWDTGERTLTQTSGDDVRTWSWQYDTTTWFKTEMTDPLDCLTTYTHDSLGRLLTITDPRLGVKTYTYNSYGKYQTVTDALNNVTTFTYGDSNWPDKKTKITGPAPFDYETTFTYDSSTGNLLTVTDPEGNTTTNTYYTTGTKNGLLKDITDPNSNKTTFDYDDFGNLTKITDALGKEMTMSYDTLSRLITVTDSLGNTSEAFYDDLDNLTKAIAPLGNTSLTEYDDLNRIIVRTDPLGRTTTTEYDVNSNVLKFTDAAGNIVQYTYDDFGNMLTLTDPMGRVYEFTYDKKDRMLSKTDPLGRKTEWEYDPYCGTITKTDPKGQVTVTSKDLLCRVSRVSYQNENAFNYDYDEVGRLTAATADGPKFGQVLFRGSTDYGAKSYGSFKYDDSSTYYGYDPNNTITYEYDDDGRIIKIGYEGDLSIDYEYDDAGRLTQITDVNGIVTQYDYSDRNQVTKIIQGSDETVYAYDDSGRNTTVTLPNGIVRTNTYNDNSQMTQIKYTKSSEVLIQLDYEFGEDGNILSKTETRLGLPEKEFSYQYDELSRLIRVDINGELAARYEYDAVGNRLVKEYEVGRYLSDPSLKNRPLYDKIEYIYDAANQIITAGNESFKHDENGNLIERTSPAEGTTTYEYNRADRLYKITLPDENEISFTYGPDNLRRKKILPNSRVINYYWNLVSNIPTVISEREGLNVSIPTTSYINGGFMSVAVKTINNLAPYEGKPNSPAIASSQFYLQDHLATTLALSDENGEITNSYDFDEYGIPIPGSTFAQGCLFPQINTYNPKQYSGSYWDSDSNLLYLQNRYYDPILGSFTRNDPIDLFLESGYAYIPNSNPLSFIDPLGTNADVINNYDVFGQLSNWAQGAIGQIGGAIGSIGGSAGAGVVGTAGAGIAVGYGIAHVMIQTGAYDAIIQGLQDAKRLAKDIAFPKQRQRRREKCLSDYAHCIALCQAYIMVMKRSGELCPSTLGGDCFGECNRQLRKCDQGEGFSTNRINRYFANPRRHIRIMP